MRTAAVEVQIRPAAGLLDLVRTRELFGEYAAWLGIDLSFQDFATEVATLPGAYAPPRGCLLLALSEGQAAGCVALRPLAGEDGAAELKRLWVRPAFRGRHIGRRLVSRVIEAARDGGYRRLVLDTLAQMQSAQSLYRAAGFAPIPAYYANPVPGAQYLALELKGTAR